MIYNCVCIYANINIYKYIQYIKFTYIYTHTLISIDALWVRGSLFYRRMKAREEEKSA